MAIVNASQAAPEPDTIALVVDPSAAVVSAADGSAPSFQPEPLPPIVVPSPPASGEQPPAAAASAVPEATSSPAAPPSSITSKQARSLVMSEVPGSLVSVEETTRGGFRAYAVTVMQADGSTVTGYVTKADGVIFDWTQTAAPAQAQAQGAADDDVNESHDGGEHEGSDHDGDDD